MKTWHPRANEVFAQASEIESAQHRAQFLDDACGDDEALRREAEELLKLHERAGSFLEKPDIRVEQTVDVDPGTLKAGLAATFSSEAAVVVGDAGHSVLKSLGKSLTRVPRVTLRDFAQAIAPPANLPGEPGSRYELRGEIARGGMGAILRGRDTDLGRDLAIKVLLDSQKDNPDVVARFVEEAQIGGQLQHPGIVPVHELGQLSDQRPFFSMKLVQGETLSSMLANRQDPSEELPKFLGIFEQVCQTMAYAHSRGVIHRDLKPANIMVGAFGEVQVMDWGLAKVLGETSVSDELDSEQPKWETDLVLTWRSGDSGAPDQSGSQTRIGSVMGTPAYMPPEQALGEVNRLDERADVFGLGAILCEILTGKPPYVSDHGAEVYRQAVQAKLEKCFERLHAAGVDDELVVLNEAMLLADSDERLRDAGVVAERITGYLEGVQQRLKAAEVAQAEAHARAEEERRRRKLQLAIAGIVLLVAVSAGVAANQFRELAADNLELAENNFRLAETNRKQLYKSDMGSAREAWDGGNVERAVQLLRRHVLIKGQEDLRGFAWHHLWRLCRSSLDVPSLKGADIQHAIAISPDGRLVACGGRTNLTLWDFETQERVGVYPCDKQYVWDVVFSPDGRHVVTANHQSTSAKVWNIEAAEQQFPPLIHDSDVRAVAVSPDGSLLASGGGSPNLGIWDMSTGEKLRSLLVADESASGHAIASVAFSPSGNYLATGGDAGKAELWDLQAYRKVQELDVGVAIRDLAFSPDGRLLVVLHGQNLTLWDLGKWESRVLFDNAEEKARTVAFSPDGKTIAYPALGNVVKLVDIATGDEVNRVEFGSLVNSMAFAPDGGRLCIAGAGARLWNLADQPISTVRAHHEEVRSVAFSPDGLSLASGGHDGAVRVWDLSTWTLRQTYEPGHWTYTVRYAPDGEELAYGGTKRPISSVGFWDLRTHEALEPLHGHLLNCWSVAYSPDHKYFVTGSEDGRVGIWNRESAMSEIVTSSVHGKQVRCVAISADSKTLASSSSDSTIKIWNLATGEVRFDLAGHSTGVWSLAFSPDGKSLASQASNGTLKFWNLETRDHSTLIERAGGDGNGNSLAFTIDGRTLIAGAGRAVRLWDVNTLEEVIRLPTRSHVECIALAPDGVTIVAGLADGTLQIWRAATVEEVRRANWWKALLSKATSN